MNHGTSAAFATDGRDIDSVRDAHESRDCRRSTSFPRLLWRHRAFLLQIVRRPATSAVRCTGSPRKSQSACRASAQDRRGRDPCDRREVASRPDCHIDGRPWGRRDKRSRDLRQTVHNAAPRSRHPASGPAGYWTLGRIELRSILSARSRGEPTRYVPSCSRRKMRAKPSRANRPDTVHLRSLRQRPGTGPTGSWLRTTEFVRGLIRNSSGASLPANVSQERADCVYGQCRSARCSNAAAFRKDGTNCA